MLHDRFVATLMACTGVKLCCLMFLFVMLPSDSIPHANATPQQNIGQAEACLLQQEQQKR